MPKRVLTGVVTSDKMQKTRRVEIDRLVQHPIYKKYIRRRTVCFVHDENNDSAAGDLVEIVESHPLSKKKRWTLTRVVQKSTAVDLAALRAVRRGAATPAEEEAIEAAHEGEETPGGQAAAGASEPAGSGEPEAQNPEP